MYIPKKLLLCILLFIISICFIISNFSINYKEGLFTIETGETLKTISCNLKDNGFIKSSHLFYIQLYLKDNPENIKAGTYKLNSHMSTNEIIKAFISGNTVKEKIVIQEGWTINNIAQYLEKKGLFEKQDFFDIAGKQGQASKDLSNEFKFLKEKPKQASLEGFLFPDTYYINKNDTAEIIIKKMLANFEKKVWDKIEDKSNFYDTLTIGSLIEKEVNKEEDKKKVAHVILKRLEIDMLLQIDATILYVNNGFNSKIDSPYNTYKYKGLPITPICNPGLESIQAVLDPIENNYYYYLSDKNGVTYFSENYDQHVRYKNLYLR
ncbi:MAG: endolytic transglycosylase MltG [Minisyncoccales bacterium]|jgi:UPF0755 protein